MESKGKKRNKRKDWKSVKDERSTTTPRERDDDQKDGDKSKKRTPFNDFEWYNKNPSLIVSAASLPYAYRPGMWIKTATKQPSSSAASTDLTNTIPGIMAIVFDPSVGRSNNNLDPASIAGKEIYARVRSAFSGELKADPQDYIMYLGALDAVFSYIASLKRVFRVANSYNGMNYMIPDGLLRAMGFGRQGRENLRNNLMQFYQGINELVLMTRKFHCPAVFPLFNRHYWLNDNVYADDGSPNSQMYLFSQASYYKFQIGTSADTGEGRVQVGQLQATAAPFYGNEALNTPNVFNGSPQLLINFGKGLIEALAGSSDAYTISGYLMRAYEGYPTFTVDELQYGETFAPVYVPEVLSQIENSQSIGMMKGDVLSNLVNQRVSDNSVVAIPMLERESGVTATTLPAVPSRMVSIRSDAPTVIDTVEATRLSTNLQNWHMYSGTPSVALASVYPASEIVRAYYVVDKIGEDGTPSGVDVSSVIKASDPNTARILSAWSAFDWSPRLTLVDDFVDPTFAIPVWDIHNVTQIPNSVMEDINKVVLYSLFNSFNQ